MPLERARELTRRAYYVVTAASRVAGAVIKGRSVRESLDGERANFKAHVRATERRLAVDAAMKAQEKVHGPLLGWHSKLDERTTPDCREAHGKNFTLTSPPAIGLPGTPHPNCRCAAGAPWPDGEILR